jgi:NADPH-dependent 2,4-dienoyl-CoA reductase/sulfur reductase-like enzyme
MLGTGPLIAVYVVSLYVFLAPVVLFGIFVLFDVLSRTFPDGGKAKIFQNLREKDPAVWTAGDITAFLDQA